jgi:hypothetical protein
MNRNRSLALGIVATLAATWLWHGPGGAGDRLTAMTSHEVRAMLDHYEMQQVGVAVEHAPLTRRILLSGPADEFQHGEIVRRSEEIPGVREATWRGSEGGSRPLPLLAEAMLTALVAFAAGVILAYITALRRRAREAILA